MLETIQSCSALHSSPIAIMVFQLYLDDEPSLGERFIGVASAIEKALARINTKGIARIDLHFLSGALRTTAVLNSKVLDIRSGIDYARLRTANDEAVEHLFDSVFQRLHDALPALSSELQDEWTSVKASQYRPTFILWKKKHGSTGHQITIQFGPNCATIYHEFTSASGDQRRDHVMDVHPSAFIYSQLFNSFAPADDGIVVSSGPIINRSFKIINGEAGLRSVVGGVDPWDEWSLLLQEFVACGTSNERRRAIMNS